MFNPRVNSPTRLPGAPGETYDGTGFVNSDFLSGQPLGMPMQMDMAMGMDKDKGKEGMAMDKDKAQEAIMMSPQACISTVPASI